LFNIKQNCRTCGKRTTGGDGVVYDWQGDEPVRTGLKNARSEKRKRLVFDKGSYTEIQPILPSHVSTYEWQLCTSANQIHHINTLPYPQAHSVISKTEPEHGKEKKKKKKKKKKRERERERETLILISLSARVESTR
jgi:hypothetical protein